MEECGAIATWVAGLLTQLAPAEALLVLVMGAFCVWMAMERRADRKVIQNVDKALQAANIALAVLSDRVPR